MMARPSNADEDVDQELAAAKRLAGEGVGRLATASVFRVLCQGRLKSGPLWPVEKWATRARAGSPRIPLFVCGGPRLSLRRVSDLGRHIGAGPSAKVLVA